MDLQTPSDAAARLCPCACPLCCRRSSPSRRRSVKRRIDSEEETVAAAAAAAASICEGDVFARVEVQNEVAALREAIASQQQTIQELCVELEEERNAAASAASEAMSMILRLQREKAEVQMEARQFKRFAEEKMDHDYQELLALEDILFRRDEAVDSLTAQLEVCRRRLLSIGIDPGIDDGIHEGRAPQFDDLPIFDYPPLKCALPDDAEREEDHGLGKTPIAKENLEDLEKRIFQLETSPEASGLLEKGVIEESPPPSPGHLRQSSADSDASRSGAKSQEIQKGEDFPASTSKPTDDDGSSDDISDRVYTIDVNATKEEKKKEMDGGPEAGNADINNLYVRLQALEADRESMREAIVSMRKEKAQLLLFREIAQQLCKEAAAPERRMMKPKASTANSVVHALKWMLTFVIWKKKTSRTKYAFGSSNNNVGLMLLLEKTPLVSNWRQSSIMSDGCSLDIWTRPDSLDMKRALPLLYGACAEKRQQFDPVRV